jgi:hypothetical protein
MAPAIILLGARPVVGKPTAIALNRGTSRSRIFRFGSGLRTTMKSQCWLFRGSMHE